MYKLRKAAERFEYRFSPVSDPYTVGSVNLADRFRFKAVVLGNDTQVALVLNALEQPETQDPLVIQVAPYAPSFLPRDSDDIPVSYADQGQPTITDVLENVRMTKNAAKNSKGGDPSMVDVDLKICGPGRIKWNGRYGVLKAGES